MICDKLFSLLETVLAEDDEKDEILVDGVKDPTRPPPQAEPIAGDTSLEKLKVHNYV